MGLRVRLTPGFHVSLVSCHVDNTPVLPTGRFNKVWEILRERWWTGLNISLGPWASCGYAWEMKTLSQVLKKKGHSLDKELQWTVCIRDGQSRQRQKWIMKAAFPLEKGVLYEREIWNVLITKIEDYAARESCPSSQNILLFCVTISHWRLFVHFRISMQFCFICNDFLKSCYF